MPTGVRGLPGRHANITTFRSVSEVKMELEDLMSDIKKTANKVRAKLKGKLNSITIARSYEDYR